MRFGWSQPLKPSMIVNLAEPEADRSRSQHANSVLEAGLEAIRREYVDAVYRYRGHGFDPCCAHHWSVEYTSQ